MKRLLLLAAVVTFASCAKEEERLYVRLTATCEMCAVEYIQDGTTRRDTVIGLLQYEWNDGVATVDTVPVSASWNIVRKPGEVITFSACPIASNTEGITLAVSGDVRPINTQTSEGCAKIEQEASR